MLSAPVLLLLGDGRFFSSKPSLHTTLPPIYFLPPLIDPSAYCPLQCPHRLSLHPPRRDMPPFSSTTAKIESFSPSLSKVIPVQLETCRYLRCLTSTHILNSPGLRTGRGWIEIPLEKLDYHVSVDPCGTHGPSFCILGTSSPELCFFRHDGTSFPSENCPETRTSSSISGSRRFK